ncbi:MAG: reverse transcriptase/maturase family protein [Candidatus Berkelbacteria bacterium]|nr:reverse transcriptase/maturase family protein [Candidatus Berkelbacteria bacterium]
MKYIHANYEEFKITDPKPRIIHKATVRDRLLHHAVHRILYPLFDQIFIFDSFSSRQEKGIHKAFFRMAKFTAKTRGNNLAVCWSLKCDIKKFFHNIDHQILLKLLAARIDDDKLLILLEKIIQSFEMRSGKGIPLGNLTSQLFANIYLDPLDKFIKHKLRVKSYLRYADDFILLSKSREELLEYLQIIKNFVSNKLKLEIHPNKIQIRKLAWGIDFVGYVNYPKFNLVRRKTIKRIFKRLENVDGVSDASIYSYLGHLKHANTFELSKKIRKYLNKK